MTADTADTAADTTAATPKSGPGADGVAIASLSQQVVAAWAYADADGFAAVFTPDATMILPGVMLTGQDAIRAYMAEAFAGVYQDTQVTGRPLAMRFLTSDVCLMLTMGGVLAPGESEPTPQSAIRASWLAVRTADGWRLAAYQNTPRD
jgi:uncharacterized protein (TIGR02246 family)